MMRIVSGLGCLWAWSFFAGTGAGGQLWAEGLSAKKLAAGFGAEFYGDSKLDFGARLKFPLGELRLAFNADDSDSFNFGLTATNDRLTKVFPSYIKCGNLSAAGALSRMNSPELSASAAPFSGAAAGVQSLTASLPGYTVFSRPVSLFVESGFKPRSGGAGSGVWSGKLSCWYSPEEDKLAFSTLGSLSLGRGGKSSLSASASAGFFPYKELGGSSWFFSEPYYAAGSHFCSLFQLGAALPFLKSSLSFGVNETPFGYPAPFYRVETKLTAGHFSLSASGFYCGETWGARPLLAGPNITASAKVLEPELQLKTNLQYKTMLRMGTRAIFPVFLKTGFSFYGSFLLREDASSVSSVSAASSASSSGADSADPFHTLKAGVGTQLLFPVTLIQLSALTTMSLAAQLPSSEEILALPPHNASISLTSATVSLKDVLYLGDFSPSLAAALTITPSKDYSSVTNTYKLTAGLTFSGLKNLRLGGTSSCTVTQKSSASGTSDSWKFTGSLTAQFLWKKIKCTGKLSFSLES